MQQAVQLRPRNQRNVNLSVVRKPIESYILMNTVTCKIILQLHTMFKCEQKVKDWLDTPNRNFGNVSPRQMINHDRGSRVMEMIADMRHRNGKAD